MATVSKTIPCKQDEPICQGDIFRNIKYSYIDNEDNENVDIVELTFSHAIIISQGCDVISMSNLETEQSGKVTKFMPSILMCPIYNKSMVRNAAHLSNIVKELCPEVTLESYFNSDDLKVTKKDWHYRYHYLSISNGKDSILNDAIIDYKHYFTVPAQYLIKERGNRICRLDSIYAEQITLKFAVYLSRVAIPD